VSGSWCGGCELAVLDVVHEVSGSRSGDLAELVLLDVGPLAHVAQAHDMRR
jgi:hypothetical protein